MLFNDLLRAVHDYFAHNITEAQFGPLGEAAAWRNHMATTPDPMARWALTAETRLQNAWQNFRRGVQDLTLMQRGFADQKAALPPINFVLTGDRTVDAPVMALIKALTGDARLGSLPPQSVEAKGIKNTIQKIVDTKTPGRSNSSQVQHLRQADHRHAGVAGGGREVRHRGQGWEPDSHVPRHRCPDSDLPSEAGWGYLRQPQSRLCFWVYINKPPVDGAAYRPVPQA